MSALASDYPAEPDWTIEPVDGDPYAPASPLHPRPLLHYDPSQVAPSVPVAGGQGVAPPVKLSPTFDPATYDPAAQAAERERNRAGFRANLYGGVGSIGEATPEGAGRTAEAYGASPQVGRAIADVAGTPILPGGAEEAAASDLPTLAGALGSDESGALAIGRVRYPKAGYVRQGDIWVPENLNRPMGSEAVSTYPHLGEVLKQNPELEPHLPYLSPEEAATVTPGTAPTLSARLGLTEQPDISALPSPEDYAMASYAGRVKRGWYGGSSQAIQDITGQGTAANPTGVGDPYRFSRGMAAMSPQTSVESNAKNFLNTFVNWDKAGRPTDPAKITAIMGQSVEGTGGEASVLGAWRPNTVRALSDTEGPLGGAKVHSFSQNVFGDPVPVTNDAWEAHFAGLPGKAFSPRGATPAQLAAGNPNFNATYLANAIRARQASEDLTQRLPGGPPWTPAESQETRWTLTKGLVDAATGKQTPSDILPSLTHQQLYSTPDFAKLFADPNQPYGDILRRAYPGYGSSVPNTSPFTSGVPGFGVMDPRGLVLSDAGPFESSRYQAFLQNLARRQTERLNQ
jgi:hypothetical protein